MAGRRLMALARTVISKDDQFPIGIPSGDSIHNYMVEAYGLHDSPYFASTSCAAPWSLGALSDNKALSLLNL